MRPALLLLFASCATGFGESAGGTVEIVVGGAPADVGGLELQMAYLGIGEIELPAAEQEEPPDDGHGHAHLRAALSLPASIDLLGAPQHLRTRRLPAAHYESAHVALEAIDGCMLELVGKLDERPLRVCLEDGEHLELPLELDVEHGERVELHLEVALRRIMEVLKSAQLQPDADGVLRVDGAHDRNTGALLRQALREAIAAEVHEHAGH